MRFPAAAKPYASFTVLNLRILFFDWRSRVYKYYLPWAFLSPRGTLITEPDRILKGTYFGLLAVESTLRVYIARPNRKTW